MRRKPDCPRCGKSTFNHQMSRIYDSFNPNSFSSRLLGEDLIDQSLLILCKLAEIKRLTTYISSTPIRQSGNCFTGHPFVSYSEDSMTPRSHYDDLEIAGYKGFLCKRCLIAHPLPLYYDKFSKKSKIHEMKHHCNAERLLEIQRRVDKKNYLVELYKNQLQS
jgi:hypothetical protein